MVLALVPLMALADTEVVGGLTWTYTVSGGQASVGSGSVFPPAILSLAVPRKTTGAIVIPATLGNCPVTSIGDRAFSGCRGLNVVYVDKGDASRVKGLYDWPSSVTFVEGVPPTAEEKPQER